MATTFKIPSVTNGKKYFVDKMTFITGPVEMEQWVEQDQPVNIVDVRASKDYAEGHIRGVIHLRKDRWGDAKALKASLRKDRISILYCYSHVCHLAVTAPVLFASNWYPVMELGGDWRWWKSDGFDVET